MSQRPVVSGVGVGTLLVLAGALCCLLAAFGVSTNAVDLFPLGVGIAFVGFVL